MNYALMIWTCVSGCIRDKKVRVPEQETEGSASGSSSVLPASEDAKLPARQLLSAFAACDGVQVLNALEAMRILALCPDPTLQFPRMELAARQIQGRAKMVFFVDLSYFAVEAEDYENAKKYALKAHEFNPAAWELYSLCVAEGLVSLSEGRKDEAISYLHKAADACLADVETCLGCGISPANFALAEELLKCGDRIEVLRHLLDCSGIWRTIRPQIMEWVRVTEEGGMPDFTAGGSWRIANAPGGRLATQCRNARVIDAGRYPEAYPMHSSRDHILAEVERMRAEFVLPRSAKVPEFLSDPGLRGEWPGNE
jgi:tetratricopeptide (TPR) repeat protein